MLRCKLEEMNIELTIKNYRCFSDEKPARISIRPGFTAFLGINNSGKSSLLRFFYEFRDLFSKLSSPGITASSNNRHMNEICSFKFDSPVQAELERCHTECCGAPLRCT